MVSTMQVVGEEKMVTGSRDGTIKIWDRSLEIIRTFDMKTMATQSSVKPYGKNVFPPCFFPPCFLLVSLLALSSCSFIGLPFIGLPFIGLPFIGFPFIGLPFIGPHSLYFLH